MSFLFFLVSFPDLLKILLGTKENTDSRDITVAYAVTREIDHHVYFM